MLPIWLLAAYCSLLLLAAAYLLLTCCCSPAAHPDSLHWDHHPGEIHRGNKNQHSISAFQDSSQVSLFQLPGQHPSQVFDLHFLGNAQIIPTTAPDAMLMSWCPTGPKSTYLLFPRPHNGTGCYVNEPVPELIYAMLNFVGVDKQIDRQIDRQVDRLDLFV